MAAPAKKALVIVESPSKAKTIQKYLGREYIVKASVGHIKDLPKSQLGVDPDKNFRVDYQLIPSKEKVMQELKEAASRVPTLYLATDPDREGEAIAWHIHEELKARGKKFHRVLFNAITKAAVKEAMESPTTLNADMVAAQQARRVLDRLVGYKISPILWDKVRRGISAGRVQSVALRLVVERDREIRAFKPVEYWKVEGQFTQNGVTLPARLFKIDGKDPVLPNRSSIDQLLKEVEASEWLVKSIESRERQRKPVAPFITSRLQQEAARKLGFSAKKTMGLAQRLYEGVDLGDRGQHGLITYMRTDSVRTEPQALKALREHIGQTFGADFLPKEANVYKTKKSAQDAHEAIRPTSLEFTPEIVKNFVEPDAYRLYQLIWNRFVASQMTPSIALQTTVDLQAQTRSGKEITFRATGSVIKFKGFTAVYEDSEEDSEEASNSLKLPPGLEASSRIAKPKLNPTQHFTQPPPRYTDASLIKELEERGIGRPSTYASILSNILDREYVEKRDGQRYYPTELGSIVTELLVESFPNILDSKFTAEMEEKLDQVEEGTVDWKKTLGGFWKPFEKTLEKAKKSMRNVKREETPTKLKCEKCKHPMVIKWGKLGSFLACTNYPECKNTQDFKRDDAGEIVIVPKEYTDKICHDCGKQMAVKTGKFGKFLACSDYPNCKFTASMTIGIPCPVCAEDGGELTQKMSRFRRVFYSCSRFPQCNYAAWEKPIAKPCPQCKFPITTERMTKKAGLMHRCPEKGCGWSEVIETPEQAQEPKEAA
jgi:DNA topoisomerase-1